MVKNLLQIKKSVKNGTFSFSCGRFACVNVDLFDIIKASNEKEFV